MALGAAGGDAGVQHRVAGERCVVARRRRVAGGALLAAGIRHVTGRQCGAVPVGGLMAARAIAGLLLGSAGGRHVIGGPTLQSRRGCAEIETQTRLVAGVAGRRHERVFGGAHVGGAEAAGHIVRRVAGTTVRSRAGTECAPA